MADTQLIDAVRKMAGTHNMQFTTAVVCEVTAVDLSTRSCTCRPLSGVGSSDITNVQLMAAIDDGWLLVPVVNSTVIVHYAPRTVPYIAMFSQIQMAYLVAVDGIQLQGSELGGLPIIGLLVEKLNILEDTVNELNAKLNVLSPTPVIPAIINTQIVDIENTSVTQGS